MAQKAIIPKGQDLPKWIIREQYDTTYHYSECYLCRRPILNRDDWSRDHIVPRCRDGLLGSENIAPAHKLCNSQKSALTYMEYRRYLALDSLRTGIALPDEIYDYRLTSRMHPSEIVGNKVVLVECFSDIEFKDFDLYTECVICSLPIKEQMVMTGLSSGAKRNDIKKLGPAHHECDTRKGLLSLKQYAEWNFLDMVRTGHIRLFKNAKDMFQMLEKTGEDFDKVQENDGKVFMIVKSHWLSR
jgi:hypothetical protein